MKKSMSWAIFWISLLWSTAVLAEDIPMVGIAEDGSPIEVMVPVSSYQQKLTQAVVSVQQSTLPVLEQKTQSSMGWMLRTAVVGLGVKLEVGLGPLVKFGILPRFRLAFTNSREPSVP